MFRHKYEIMLLMESLQLYTFVPASSPTDKIFRAFVDSFQAGEKKNENPQKRPT